MFCTTANIWFIYIRNSIGPNIEHCGTTYETLDVKDFTTEISTSWYLLGMNMGLEKCDEVHDDYFEGVQ